MPPQYEPEDPWLKFLPANATPDIIRLARDLWNRGIRPRWSAEHSQWVWTSGTTTPAPPSAPAPAAAPGSTPTPAPGPAPGAAPGGPDWAKIIADDPDYKAALAAIQAAKARSIIDFGDATGIEGVDPTTAGAAGQNQYSVVKQLARMLEQNQAGVRNTANAHGTLFSGVTAQAQQNENAAADHRGYDARRAFLDALSGYTHDAKSAYDAAYAKATQNAGQYGGATPTPALPAPPSNATPTPSNPTGGWTPTMPGGPPTRGDLPGGSSQLPGKPPRPKTPKRPNQRQIEGMFR